MLDLAAVRELLEGIDIYLFDQILKGRIAAGARLLDAGCGDGRNVAFLLRQSIEVHGIDRDECSIGVARGLAERVASAAAAERFQHGVLDALPWPDGHFTTVLAIASLHFADHEAHFDAMLGELVRVLAPGGMLFARLASRIGLESRVTPIAGAAPGRYRLPDGSSRFLVDEDMLLARTRRHGALLEPIKTVIVQDARAMTTWVLRKGSDR